MTKWHRDQEERCRRPPPQQRAETHLQKSRDVGDDISEHVVVLLAVEPAQLGDPGVQLDQSLGHERRELRPRRQVVQHIVPCREDVSDTKPFKPIGRTNRLAIKTQTIVWTPGAVGSSRTFGDYLRAVLQLKMLPTCTAEHRLSFKGTFPPFGRCDGLGFESDGLVFHVARKNKTKSPHGSGEAEGFCSRISRRQGPPSQDARCVGAGNDAQSKSRTQRQRPMGNGRRACVASAALREERSASGFGLFYCRIAKQKFKSRV